MTLKKLLLLFISTVGILILSANNAFATTYNYVGPNYTAGNVTAPYTTAMNVTGSITTSSPIPANTTLALPPLVTSWTFFDGVQTIDSTNGQFLPGSINLITTDANGSIINILLVVAKTPIPTTLNEANAVIVIKNLVSTIDIGGSLECAAINGGSCTYAFSPSSYGATDDLLNPGQGQVAPPAGVWSIGNNSPVNVPSLSTWGILLLILSLLFLSQTRMELFAKVKSKK